MTQDIVVREPSGRTLLAPFGSRKELSEFSDRLERTITVKLKGGESRKLTKPESLQMASVCVAHGLDPWSGDVWAMETRGQFTLQIGRNAWVKAANHQIKEQGGGNHWPEYRQITEENERIQLAIPKGALAFECKLYDSPSIREYSQAVERLGKAGAPWNKIEEILGSKPYTAGIGYYIPGSSYNDESYPPAEHAMKRALTAAIKKRFSLPFDDIEGADELPPEYTGPLLPAKSQAANQTVESADYMPTDASLKQTEADLKRARTKQALYGEQEPA